ncbi:M28 family peptidase [Algimonas porphyrae]|uniref:Aminopeptidase n=1 Tax=Algimonas porphyrae TaxID=1128113 RepID=A0ABQ5V0Y8_9PROT|nr:M28 family peptidase [Algimonas porphyrae]GLQ21088.1 aminopeptidase [Algimonas porphyrae]
MKHLVLSAALLLSACNTVEPLPTADTQIAIEAMRVLSDDAMMGRAAMTDGAAMAQAYITERVSDLNDGVAPTEHAFTRTVTRRSGETRDIRGTNLITTLPGRTADGPILEITAHFDHLGMTETGDVYNGADDNASGVGALLAILASFRDAPPTHEVRLIWLDAEEMGLSGAREYVRTEIDDRPRLNLNLDMIAQNDEGVIYGSGTYHTPALAPFVKQAAAGTGLSVRLGHDRPEDGPNDWTSQSDHAAWHAAGIPFLYFGVEDHPHYHRPSDTFETIPLDTYEMTVQLAVNTAHLLDDNLAELAKARSTEP